MQEKLKSTIAIRSVARAFQLDPNMALKILKDTDEIYPIQPALAMAYLACISSINEAEECFSTELYASLSDLGLSIEHCELVEPESR